MSDQKPPRKNIFGDKPFGANPPRRPAPEPDGLAPNTPYPEHPRPAPPPPDPSLPAPDAPYRWDEPTDQDAATREPRRESPPLDKPDKDPARLSWDELIRDVSDEPEQTPKLAGEDEAFGDATANAPILSFDELEAKVARQAAPPADKPTILKPGRKRRTLIQARSYVANDGKESAPPAPLRLNGWIMLRSAGAMAGIATLAATLLTWWTPGSFLPVESQGQLALALATQSAPQPGVRPTTDPAITIGIVSGHRGINPSSGLPDPGAVCPDGLTEQSVNESIALQAAATLQAQGYFVDVLDEFDPRLAGYRALAVVSIHADSCEFVNDEASGFKVASFAASQQPEADQRLVACLSNRYSAATGLNLHQSVTFDMTDYHNFREVDPTTPGAIIEVGFLYLDREALTTRAGDAARGIVDGINCFLRNELPAAGSVTLTPAPTDLPTETPTRVP